MKGKRFWVGWEGRVIGRCKNRHVVAVEGPVWWPAECECGARFAWNPVKATVTDRICDARCMGGRSTECRCSCGGANHASAWMLVPVGRVGR